MPPHDRPIAPAPERVRTATGAGQRIASATAPPNYTGRPLTSHFQFARVVPVGGRQQEGPGDCYRGSLLTYRELLP